MSIADLKARRVICLGIYRRLIKWELFLLDSNSDIDTSEIELDYFFDLPLQILFLMCKNTDIVNTVNELILIDASLKFIAEENETV